MQPNYQNYSHMQMMHLQNQYLQKLNQILDNHQNTNKLYQNINYKFNRTNRKTLVIDVLESNMTNSNTNFEINLVEPFIIDKQCDILLEHFTTFDGVNNDAVNQSSFIFNIEQFNTKNHTNDSFLKDMLIIPNEGGGDDTTKTHKAKKLNFITTINPTKINKISGSLTLLDGATKIFHDSDTDGRFIAELIFIPRE